MKLMRETCGSNQEFRGKLSGEVPGSAVATHPEAEMVMSALSVPWDWRRRCTIRANHRPGE